VQPSAERVDRDVDDRRVENRHDGAEHDDRAQALEGRIEARLINCF